MNTRTETIDTLTAASRLRTKAAALFRRFNWTVCQGAADCWEMAEAARTRAMHHGPDGDTWDVRCEQAYRALYSYRDAIAWQKAAAIVADPKED